MPQSSRSAAAGDPWWEWAAEGSYLVFVVVLIPALLWALSSESNVAWFVLIALDVLGIAGLVGRWVSRGRRRRSGDRP
jgi:hypothetical protein